MDLDIPKEHQNEARLERCVLVAIREQFAKASLQRIIIIMDAIGKADPELHNRIFKEL